MSRSSGFDEFVTRPRNRYLLGEIRREAIFGRSRAELNQQARDEYDTETRNLLRMIHAFQIATVYVACRQTTPPPSGLIERKTTWQARQRSRTSAT